jgi:hypothetical protein
VLAFLRTFLTQYSCEIRVRLLAHSQSLELAVVESEVLDQILAHNHGPGFGEHQVLLGIAFHAGGNHDYRKSELILGQELAAGIERFLILQLGRIALIEELLCRIGKLLESVPCGSRSLIFRQFAESSYPRFLKYPRKKKLCFRASIFSWKSVTPACAWSIVSCRVAVVCSRLL